MQTKQYKGFKICLKTLGSGEYQSVRIYRKILGKYEKLPYCVFHSRIEDALSDAKNRIDYDINTNFSALCKLS